MARCCVHTILWLTVSLFLGATVPDLRAADLEARAFAAAEKYFQDHFFEHAEKAFADFVVKYRTSPRVAQALLRQAQAAREQKKYVAALSLLTTNMVSAAALADEFQFQIGKTHEESGKFAAAADSFALLVSKYTNSPLRLEATVLEAKARFNLKQWAQVAALLQNPDGVFQKAAAPNPGSSLVIDGKLLLAETLLAQRNDSAAEDVLAGIPVGSLSGENRWRCEYLRAKAQFSSQKLEDALVTSSNVVVAGAAARQPALEAAGIALQGQILEALNQPQAAIAAYQKNQRPDMPADRVREALFKGVELTVSQGQITNAITQLTNFLTLHSNELGSDVALLAVAELRLKEHQMSAARLTVGATNRAASTNLLGEAIDNAERVLRSFTNSPFAGQAQMVRGWALLALGNIPESLAAFRSAAELLPWSEAQAVARFKSADLAFQSGEFTNALRDYNRVIGEFASLRRVQNELVPRARYQVLQASILVGNRAAADAVGEAILREYPPSGFGERTLLLYGQALDELGDPAAARKAFAKFVERFPESRLLPRMELAVARTYEREHAWTRAIAKYEDWISRFPSNENLAIAEYNRALANWRSGRETNAFILFTNFVARFGTSALAAYAEDWAGDFYLRKEQFADAERDYQIVYQNPSWKLNELLEVRFLALLKAGRAALLRGSFSDATNYFATVIELSPSDALRVQAYFAYGDAYRDPISPLTNTVEKFSQALAIYSQIPREIARSDPNDPLLPRAYGEMANCYFQLGSEKPTNYLAAIGCYQRVTNAPSADLPARVQATVGIGNVLRKQAKLKQESGAPAEASALSYAALSNFLKVLYDTYEDEKPDPIWLKEAALNAAEIAEQRNEWDSAGRVYQRITELFPILRPSLEKKIATAKEKSFRK